MGKRDTRIDAYIASSAEFARPILLHLREIIHAACPDVEETMKWSRPHFIYHGMMCSMSAFAAHCGFGFWKGALVIDGHVPDGAAGEFGRITSIKDLPSKKVLTTYIKKAMQLNVDGLAVAKAKPPAKTSLQIPTELAEALATHAKAKAVFDTFPPSQQREYADWIADAKRDATKTARVAKAISQLSDGKTLNWKYEA